MSQTSAKSSDTILKSVDRAMDRANPTNGHVKGGISIRHGPVDKMDIDRNAKDAPQTNGVANGKRKARSSMTNGKSYKDASSSEEDDDKPLVC